MSFGEFKGKLVWGSSVFRILIETEQKRLTFNFNGTLLLFERRFEKKKLDFKSLNQFLSAVKGMWQDSLSQATVQDTRLARWIEEYLGELGLSVNYQSIMEALKGEFEEVKPIEVTTEEEIPYLDIPTFIADSEKIQSFGFKRTIKGDLEDKVEMEKLLEDYLKENKQTRKNEAKIITSFKLADGSENNTEVVNTIVDAPLSSHLSLNCSFTNSYSSTITDVQIGGTIPFDFQIVDTKTSGQDITKGTQEKGEGGLKVTWNLPKLEPGESANIEYILQKRMLRTILIRDDNDVTLIHTYEDINKEGTDVWVKSKYIFHDKTPVVENVKILDQIPSDLKLIASRPEAILPSGQVSTGVKETEVTWSHIDVPAKTQFVVEYDLAENPKIYRDIINLVDHNDETVAEVVKIVKPLSVSSGYGVILAIKAVQELPPDLVIKDRIINDFEIIDVHTDVGVIEQEIDGYQKIITWKINELSLNETKSAYLKYIGKAKFDTDNLTIVSLSRSIDTEVGKGMIIHKRENLILPSIYYDDVDV